MQLPVGRMNLDDSALDRVIEAIGRALGDGEGNHIAQTARRKVLELNASVRERFGYAKRNAVGGSGRIVGQPALLERFAPRTQLAWCDDFNSLNRGCIEAGNVAGGFDEAVDVVARGPQLELDLIEQKGFAKSFGECVQIALAA